VDYTLAFSSFNLINFADVDVIKLSFTNTSFSQDSGLNSFSARGLVLVSDEGASPLTLMVMALAGLMAVGRMRRR